MSFPSQPLLRQPSIIKGDYRLTSHATLPLEAPQYSNRPARSIYHRYGSHLHLRFGWLVQSPTPLKWVKRGSQRIVIIGEIKRQGQCGPLCKLFRSWFFCAHPFDNYFMFLVEQPISADYPSDDLRYFCCATIIIVATIIHLACNFIRCVLTYSTSLASSFLRNHVFLGQTVCHFSFSL